METGFNGCSPEGPFDGGCPTAPVGGGGPESCFNGCCPAPEFIVRTDYPGLDLLPADLSYRNFDVHLSERKKPTERLLRMSRSLRSAYAALFLDCPPGISLLSENVLRAADAVVVDSSALDIDQVVAVILDRARSVMAR